MWPSLPSLAHWTSPSSACAMALLERDQAIANELADRMVDIFGQAGAEKAEGDRMPPWLKRAVPQGHVADP
jgi:hypothetical protein